MFQWKWRGQRRTIWGALKRKILYLYFSKLKSAIEEIGKTNKTIVTEL